MANVTLMLYTGIPQVMNKTPQIISDLAGTFKQPLSLMNPVFELAGEQIQNYLVSSQVNYFKIEDKYYFLMDWRVMPRGVVEVVLHLDVLMTYKAEIANLNVMLERSSTSENKDINDNMYPLASNKDYVIQKFPRAFSEAEDDGTYVLVTSQNGYRTP